MEDVGPRLARDPAGTRRRGRRSDAWPRVDQCEVHETLAMW